MASNGSVRSIRPTTFGAPGRRPVTRTCEPVCPWPPWGLTGAAGHLHRLPVVGGEDAPEAAFFYPTSTFWAGVSVVRGDEHERVAVAHGVLLRDGQSPVAGAVSPICAHSWRRGRACRSWRSPSAEEAGLALGLPPLSVGEQLERLRRHLRQGRLSAGRGVLVAALRAADRLGGRHTAPMHRQVAVNRPSTSCPGRTPGGRRGRLRPCRPGAPRSGARSSPHPSRRSWSARTGPGRRREVTSTHCLPPARRLS